MPTPARVHATDIADDRSADAREVRLLARLIARDGVDDASARAARALESLEGLAGLVRATRARLVAAGLSARQADLVQSALALASSVAAARQPRERLDRAAVVALLQPTLEPLAREELHAVHLAADGAYLGRVRVAQGGLSALSIFGREVLGPALEANATHLVLAHNHPSGLSRPSMEDFALTRRVLQSAEVVGIQLVDHLVFARDGVSSAMSPPRWFALQTPDAR
jgi:DNA repair protein RadC